MKLSAPVRALLALTLLPIASIILCSNSDVSGRYTISLFGELNATFLVGVTLGGGVSFDDDGNFAFQGYYSLPTSPDTLSVGLADAGISAQLQFTNYDTVDELNGIGSSVGFSGGLGTYIGADIVAPGSVSSIFNSSEKKDSKGGIKVYVGKGVGLDIHVAQSNTKTLYKTSLSDIFSLLKTFLRGNKHV